MLFNYRYVPHSIEKFQVYLDHLVKEVWCKAAGAFSLDLLHPDLKGIIEDIANDESIKNDYLFGPIKEIFEIFRDKLTVQQRSQISAWYDSNNDIEALCRNDPLKAPGTYAQIKAIDAGLEKALKAFCKSLFTTVIHLKAMTDRIGMIEDHYKAFVAENDENRCPYCGYGDMKGQYHSRREAYDHYLPKGTYPFNSVNFRNLAPMCHECNSSYKLQKDPLHKANVATRRKAFYSYASVAPGIEIDLALSKTDRDKLSQADINLQITSPGRDEELETWKDLFGIEERYKAKCCDENDGKYWLEQVLFECNSVGKSSTELLDMIQRNAERSPWAECNFLKMPFLLYRRA